MKVCWNWKTLAESDQLWMPKCLRFGWTLSYTPSPYETGIWKRFYIENIKALQLIPTKVLISKIKLYLSTIKNSFLRRSQHHLRRKEVNLENHPGISLIQAFY